jgi:glycosyltransferase involved in cell wall biosynthesis
MVREAIPDARLILLGNGSKEPEIHALIEKHGLGDFIHAPGRVSHTLLPEYFRTADAYRQLGSQRWNFHLSLEAMASGLPVVVSDSYGNLEWVQPGSEW